MLFSALFRKNISKLDDSELIDLVRESNQRAMGEIFKRYAALVMGLCLKYLKDKDKAEDMLMDIFEKLPSKIVKGEIRNFKNWLYSVSRNECLMELRKKTSKNTGAIDDVLIYKTDESEETLQLALLKEKRLTLLEEAIHSLKTEQRQSLELFYLQKKSYDQVAEIMNVPVKKIKSLIQNGKRNLKLKLEKENGF